MSAKEKPEWLQGNSVEAFVDHALIKYKNSLQGKLMPLPCMVSLWRTRFHPEVTKVLLGPRFWSSCQSYQINAQTYQTELQLNQKFKGIPRLDFTCKFLDKTILFVLRK